MILKNSEVKSLFVKFLVVLIISIVMLFLSTNSILNDIKDNVVSNNQIIIGSIVSKYPELEDDIVGIVTQGKNSDKLNLGKEILRKYNYDKDISINSENIIEKSKVDIYKYNSILIFIIIIIILIIILDFLVNIYKNISDMTKYVYYSSEQKEYDMKNKNQEGQIGLLKTELMKMTNILRENVELLKNEKIFLNNAISDISHQLKTPMTSLILLNDIMYDDIPKEVRVDFLDKIKSQLNRMEWLIKSMLKLSKIEAKVIDFNKDDINIKELIYKSIEPSKMLIEVKNINLQVHGSDRAKFIGDINWTTEAIVNIIKNCAEHTPENGKLEIFYDENPLYSEITIKDNGEGIDKQDLPHIFKRFYKGKNSSKEDSIGIGLAMAKSIIDSQGGDIYVKSKKNHGTEFHITIHKSYCD